MAIYAGEDVLVMQSATDPVEGRLVDADASVVVTIWDVDGITELVSDDSMTYSSTLVMTDGTGGWYYRWTTPSPDPGSYRVRCTITGGGIGSAWEYKVIRTRRNPGD